MTPQEIHDRLKKTFGDKIVEAVIDNKYVEPHVIVQTDALLDVATSLSNEEDFAFDELMTLSGMDYLNTDKKAPTDVLGVSYVLYSMKHRHRFMLKVKLPRAAPEVASVSGLWPTALWHEREAFDLYGIKFIGHPDLRRILLPQDWEGHPMRKDYVVPASWHGIPTDAILPQELPLGTKY